MESPAKEQDFEPSVLVAKEPVSVTGAELPEWLNRAESKSVLSHTGDRGFESISLHQRVRCEPAVGSDRRKGQFRIPRGDDLAGSMSRLGQLASWLVGVARRGIPIPSR